MALSRTTKLKAVNIALTSSQLAPVESLSSGDIDAEQAEQILDEVSVEVQTEGWAWNTRVLETLPDVSGNIFLEDNLLYVDAVDKNLRVVQQGNKLYDLDNNTFTFESKVELIKVYAYEFEELPESCRRYISLKTARLLQSRIIGEPSLTQNIAVEERIAYNKMKADDIRSKDLNMITSGPTSFYSTNRNSNVPYGLKTTLRRR